MSYATFEELTTQLIKHFQNKQFAEALTLITAEGANFPDNRMWADYWKMCAAARVDNRAVVYQTAEQFHKDGLWYGETLWRQTPSFQSLQGDEVFEKLVAESSAMQTRDVSDESVVITKLPVNNPTPPLLIGLHGNQSTAEQTLPFWQSAVLSGWALIVPQSTQPIFKGSFIWDDLEKSESSIKDAFENFKKSNPFDSKRVVLGGHSMGGLVAIKMTLEESIPASGFVVNGPAIPAYEETGELDKLLASAYKRGTRAYFILGENDVDIDIEEIKAFVEKLKSAGLACELEMILNATHAYNPAYDAALQRGLSFVINP